jgi:hypothetical protein
VGVESSPRRRDMGGELAHGAVGPVPGRKLGLGVVFTCSSARTVGPRPRPVSGTGKPSPLVSSRQCLAFRLHSSDR